MQFVYVEETKHVLVFGALVLLDLLVLLVVLLVLIYHLVRILMCQTNLQQIHLNKKKQPKQYPCYYTYQHHSRYSQQHQTKLLLDSSALISQAIGKKTYLIADQAE